MKKVLLLAVAAMASATSFAQVSRSSTTPAVVPESDLKSTDIGRFGTAAQKTTVLSDTTYTVSSADSILGGQTVNLYFDFAAPFDTGFFYGANAQGYKGFARVIPTDRDRVAPVDSTVQFLGWFSRWGGRIQTNSTKQVTFNLWNRGTTKSPVTGRSKFFLYGKPNVATASKTVAANTLPTNGSALLTYANAPVSGINYSSYIGVTFSSTWAQTGTDTFGVRASIPVSIEAPTYTLENGTGDSLIRVPLYIQNNAGSWVSPLYDLSLGAIPAPIIAAIIRFDRPTISVKGYANNELTVFGAFPNPAATTANFKFALKSAAGVKFLVYDYSGRLITSRDLGQLPAGEQIIPQNVENLPSGAYIFTVETSKGDVVATMVDVKH